MKKNKKKIIVASIIGVVAIGAIIYYLNYSKNQKVQAKIENVPQVSSVADLMASGNKEGESYLTGKVSPNAVSKINADSTKGKINEVSVKVGDKVTKGQKLFSYSNPDGDIAIGDASTEISKMQNKINQLTEAIASKREQLNRKYTELTNQKNKIGNASEEEKSALEQEKATLEDTISTNQMDIESAKAELNDATLDFQKAEKNQELTNQKYSGQEVLSEVDGIVQKIDDAQISSTSNSGGQPATFMEIMDTSSLRVQGKVDEFKKEGLKVGQPVKIIDRKNQSKTWKGKIDRIDATAIEEEKESTISKYAYDVTIDGGEDLPNIGNHVYIQPEKNLETGISIPAEYVFEETSKKMVWKVVKGQATKQEVTVGEINKETKLIEVKTGLKMEDQIIFPTPKIKEGMKVDSHD